MKAKFLAGLLALVLAATQAVAQVSPDRTFPLGGSAASVKAKADAELGELYRRAPITASSTTGTNAYTLTSAPAVTTLSQGLTVNFTPPNSNTGAVTLKLDSTAFTALTKPDGSAMDYGDLLAGVPYRAAYLGSAWVFLGEAASAGRVVTVESLGAKADGADDGARISAGLYAKYNGLGTSQSKTFVDIHFKSGKTYMLTTPIVVRQQRLRFFCDGATLDGATTGTYAFDITQDSTGNSNEAGTIDGCKITRFATAAVRGRTNNFWKFTNNYVVDNANGFDIHGVEPHVAGNYIRNSGTGVKLSSQIVTGGGRTASQRAQVFGNIIYGLKDSGSSATQTHGYCINLIDGGGHYVSNNDCETNDQGEIYVQSSFGNQFHTHYSEVNASEPFVVKQDNSAGTGMGTTSDGNIYENFTLGGGALFDFDIQAGNGTYLGQHRLGTGNIRVASGVSNTMLYPNLGGAQGTLTDAGTGTKDLRNLPTLPAGSVTATQLAAGSAVTNIGFTPMNPASPNMTAAFTVTTAGSQYSSFNRPAGNDAAFTSQSSGVNRWLINFANAAAESGSNAGSDFQLIAYGDAGAQIGTALYLTRSNMMASFGSNIRVPAGAYMNFGASFGAGGYGFFDNAGTLQGKNSGGSFSNILLSAAVTGDFACSAYTCTIGSGVVSNAKLATMAANTTKCNNTGATAAPVDCTAAQEKAMLAIASTDVSGLGALATVTPGTGVASAAAIAPRAAGGFETTFTAATAISAAGTTQGTATALTSTSDNQLFEVTTVAASAGVVLPASTASMTVKVSNRGANPLAIYPASTGTIDGGAASAAITIPVNAQVEITAKDASNNWYSDRITSITGGAIDGTPLGATTASTVAATTLTASSTVTLSPANANVTISPSGTGTVTLNPATASSINNMSIGATTAGSGRFSTITSTAAATFSPANAAVTLSPTGTGNVVIGPATAGTINNMSIGVTTPLAGNFTTLGANSAVTYHAPVTVTAATYTVLATDYAIIFNTTAACTVTLGTATAGRTLKLLNIAAFAINSASSNVTPITSATAGTAIIAATAGKFVELVGDGTNWRVMAGN